MFSYVDSGVVLEDGIEEDGVLTSGVLLQAELSCNSFMMLPSIRIISKRFSSGANNEIIFLSQAKKGR